MFTPVKRFVSIAAVMVGMIVAARPAQAQNFAPGVSPFFQIRPGLNISQFAYNAQRLGSALQTFPPYAFNNPYGAAYTLGGGLGGYGGAYGGLGGYGGYGGYGGGYGSPYLSSYYDPYYGILKGSSDIIQAQGTFMVDQQKAFLMREQWRGEALKNRKTKFDEDRYEREHSPSAEELRLRNMQFQVMRSRNNPPSTEINSAVALNNLLQDIRTASRGNTQLRTYQVPLAEDTLKRINVTKGNGNVGILKNEGRLTWPVALSGVDFKSEREQINSLVRDAVNQASYNGQVEAGTIMQLNHDTTAMKEQLRRTGYDLPPSLYIEANTFINNLNDAIKLLQQPDAGNYFTGKYALKAKTVPELVNFMSTQGLQFAAATPGDEPAYAALQEALASYDRAVNPDVEKDLAAKK